MRLRKHIRKPIKKRIMGPIEQAVNRFWYPSEPYRGAPKLFYRLAQPLNKLTTAYTRHKFAQRKLLQQSEHPSEPVIIVVGNISVGGTGKTPVIITLVEWLKTVGMKPGVISRGYGRQQTVAEQSSAPQTASMHQNDSIVVEARHQAEEVGDEPLLIYQRTQVPVVVDQKRFRAMTTLKAQFPDVDVILSDDGMQHYALPRHIEIAVIDQQRGVGNGCCLPVGPLREPVERLKAVDMLLVNQTHQNSSQISSAHNKSGDESNNHENKNHESKNHDENRQNQFDAPYTAYFTLQSAGFFRVVDDQPITQPSEPSYAVSGIGNPKRFFNQLASMGLSIHKTKSFPDHHPFSLADFREFEKLSSLTPILMTEKDAVKCRQFAKPHWYYLKVESQFNQTCLEHLATLIQAKTS